MVDVHTPAQRSHNMSRIKSKDTSPELRVRHALFGLGYRYRVHVSALPGKPDIVFTRKMKVIHVNGCFWHSHACRYGCVTPKTNSIVWERKRAATLFRDERNNVALVRLGWSALTVWECELRDMDSAMDRIVAFLEG